MTCGVTTIGKKPYVPQGPKVPCIEHGCPAVVTQGQGYCDKHKRSWEESQRIYLYFEPHCRDCERERDVLVPSTIAHQYFPPEHQEREWWSHLLALCESCHEKRVKEYAVWYAD